MFSAKKKKKLRKYMHLYVYILPVAPVVYVMVRVVKVVHGGWWRDPRAVEIMERVHHVIGQPRRHAHGGIIGGRGHRRCVLELGPLQRRRRSLGPGRTHRTRDGH